MENLTLLTGKKFGRLTITEVLEPRKHRKCIVVCECGTKKEVFIGSLKQGLTKSCGCLLKEGTHKTHGMSNTRLGHILENIVQRCYNPKKNTYKDYGGRGIIICDEWLNDRGAFYKWAKENGYSDNLEIDRINNNGIYEPNNCRWVTRVANMNNRRNTLYVKINGRSKTVANIARENNMTQIFDKRIRRGWDVHKAIATPIRSYNHKKLTNATN